MNTPIDDKKETVTFRGVSHDEEGKKKVTKLETNTHNIETLKHIEKKLTDKGVHRKDRRPIDGIPLNKQSKSGHGGKFTWEGPRDVAAEYELDGGGDLVVAIDENDPNYVDDEEEGASTGVEGGLVVGEVDVAKVVGRGVGRVDVVDPRLQENM